MGGLSERAALLALTEPRIGNSLILLGLNHDNLSFNEVGRRALQIATVPELAEPVHRATDVRPARRGATEPATQLSQSPITAILVASGGGVRRRLCAHCAWLLQHA